MRLYFALLFIGSHLLCFAQDSLASSPIVIPSLYFDYGKTFNSLFDGYRKTEGGLELTLDNSWQVIGELGHWSLEPESAIENGFYKVNGTYWRLGFGYIPSVKPDSRLGIGLRYGFASFVDQGNYTIAGGDSSNPALTEEFKRRDLSASWYELVFYSDKTINRWITLGFLVRLRRMNTYDKFQPVDVVTVPGYGRAQDRISPAVNLFLKIPLVK